MARDTEEGDKVAQAHAVFLRLVLPPYTIHFKSSTYLYPATLDLLDRKVCKETLKSTAQNTRIRQAIGCDRRFWADLVLLLRAAIPSLERRSFSIWDPSSVDYESTSGALIAANYPGLWRDLERLHDLISISRNVLTAGGTSQDCAAEHHIDEEIFRLVNCCVRVTARGYDGDAGTGEEEKWQWIVNAYKKLLITSLQFLNNLVAQNEKRKLMLWMALFDSSNDGGDAGTAKKMEHTSDGNQAAAAASPTRPIPPVNDDDVLLAFGVCNGSHISPLEMEAAIPLYKEIGFKPIPASVELHKKTQERCAYVYYVHQLRDVVVQDFTLVHGRNPTLAEIHLNLPHFWHSRSESDAELWSLWSARYDKAFKKYVEQAVAYESWQASQAATMRQSTNAGPSSEVCPRKITETNTKLDLDEPQSVERTIEDLEKQLAAKYKAESANALSFEPPTHTLDGDIALSSPIDFRLTEQDDMRMQFTAEAGAKTLESGKAELMKRLDSYPASELPRGVYSNRAAPPERASSMSRSPVESRIQGPNILERRHTSDPTIRTDTGSDVEVEDAFAEDSLDEEEVSDEEGEEDDEEDYPGSTEDGRGLLTDVPLILGPSEIEVLPMLIMSGMVPPTSTPGSDPTSKLNNTHAVRTHLLLSQTSGRNLLRELLIFVAAWDLREEELYFKFMVKIMEAILKTGLMPYAYHAFRDRSRSKDIISPAQAVIMKLLTCIFRGRSEAAKAASSKESNQRSGAIPQPRQHVSSRVDLHILNFIFTEFRQHIIPQTCALIFLQGQIHKGRASPDDFPLNLWDMERMYEGVYQYLEFFAVLTEENGHAQQAAAKRPEDRGWWSWKHLLAEWEMASELVTLLRELEDGIPKVGATPALPQLPRRVLPQQGQQTMAPPQRSLSADTAGRPLPVAVERPFDPEPLPPVLPPGQQVLGPETPLAYPEADPVPAPHDQDEPSDFEWRNLKKLTVLVLSSLIWKNPLVQKQVREAGGLEALVGCCKSDEHNPYIREHAIMCLRFAVEGCEENAQVIRKMASAAPRVINQNQERQLKGGSVTLAGAQGNSQGLEAGNDVPHEVLDTNGYESYVDSRGGLRLKPTLPRLSANETTVEKAAELMQNALRDLPLGDKLVTDRQKAEALARLDKAFESTEKALGKGAKK